MTANGTTKLTPEQQQYWFERFGVRYTHVQWQPGTMNRKERRMLKRGRAYER